MTTRAERARLKAHTHRIVTLAEIPELIAYVWPEEVVTKGAPRIWWWRTRHDEWIAEPMPAPITYDPGSPGGVGPGGAGTRARGEWRGEEVVSCDARWKGLTLPEWFRRK